MKIGLAKWVQALAVLIFALWLAPVGARAGVIVTAEAPGVQSSQVPQITTETFNGFTPGVYTTLSSPIGTYTSPGLAVVTADIFGGANGSRFFSVGVQSGHTQATLALNGPQSYFGFWWSAADPENFIQFFLGNTLEANFNPTSALGALGGAYFGNPNGGDSGEKFAYLNIIGTNGTTFDRIVFANTGLASGFESDNHSVRAAALTPPLPGIIVIGDITVPEPVSAIVMGMGLMGAFGYAWYRRRRVGDQPR